MIERGERMMAEYFRYTVAEASLVSARFANRVENRTAGAILTVMGVGLILLRYVGPLPLPGR